MHCCATYGATRCSHNRGRLVKAKELCANENTKGQGRDKHDEVDQDTFHSDRRYLPKGDPEPVKNDG